MELAGGDGEAKRGKSAYGADNLAGLKVCESFPLLTIS